MQVMIQFTGACMEEEGRQFAEGREKEREYSKFY